MHSPILFDDTKHDGSVSQVDSIPYFTFLQPLQHFKMKSYALDITSILNFVMTSYF